MNQNNNIMGYNLQTGQTPLPQKSNKGLVIVAILAIIAIIAGIFLFTNQDKKEPTNNKNPNNSELENNKPNNDQQNNNSIGRVEEGTNTTYDGSGAFLFSIEDVFTISGRGTVVTGTVERGTINLNDEVQVIGLDNEIITTTVTGIEVFRKNQDFATVGDNPGLLLKGVERDQVQRGQVVAKPNSIVAATKFDADVHILSKEEGGRHTPFFANYRPQFYFRAIDITGGIDLPDNIEMVNPGDDVSFSVTLVYNVAMEVGTEFSIREGGRTIGKGTVTKIY